MADMAEYAYEQSNKLMQATMTTFLSFLKILADNINDQISYAPYKKLAKWIKEGGECKIYQIQAREEDLERVVEEMRRRIEKEQLGALRITNSGLVIVPSKDLEAVQEINRDILLESCNYYQEVNLKEMENAIANLPPMVDKDMLVLKNISKYEAEVIKNKSNNITQGFMVGISDVDDNGRCNLGVRAEKVFIENTGSKKSDFCKSSLNAMLSLWGVNHTEKVKEIDTDAHIDNLIYAAADKEEVHYIAGSDKKTYIELSKDGYSLYSIKPDNKGHFIGDLKKRVNRDDVNFFSEIEIELDKLMDEKLFTNVEELNEFLTTNNGPESNRGDKESPRSANAKIQKNLADEMDKMIKHRIISNENYALLDVEAKYNCYMLEASNLLLALAKDELIIPAGYTEEQMTDLKKYLITEKGNTYGFGTDPKEDKSTLSRVATKIHNFSVEQYRPEPVSKYEKEVMKKEREQHGNFNVEDR